MSDDLIKRSDAIGACAYETIECYEARKAIRALPSADRPQGRNLSEEYPSLFECSVCGASCDDTYPWDCDIKFCPNCGADMRGDNDGKDIQSADE